jgi:hypothetical protein
MIGAREQGMRTRKRERGENAKGTRQRPDSFNKDRQDGQDKGPGRLKNNP